jgi:uncharacterized protein YlxP (DUF503 family)
MLVGIVRVVLFLPCSSSLKEKRFVLQSLKNKIRNRFNVSIAEVDFHDKWQRSCLGISCVSNDRRHIDEMISKVISAVEKDDRVEVMDQVIEIF